MGHTWASPPMAPVWQKQLRGVILRQTRSSFPGQLCVKWIYVAALAFEEVIVCANASVDMFEC